MSANIFISFASVDRKVATTLCTALESRGFSCWIASRDIHPGENFQIAIVRAIRNAKMMLLVFTANSNASDEMSKELALASQQKLIVVPLRIEDVAPNEAFAYEFATRQWIDFFADWEAAINQLCDRLAQAMPPEPPKPVPAPAPVITEAPAVAWPEPEPEPPKPAPAPVVQAAPAPPPSPPRPPPAPEIVKPAPEVKPAPAAKAAPAPAKAAPTEFKPAEAVTAAKAAADAKPVPPAKPAGEAQRPSTAPPVKAQAGEAPAERKGAPVGLFIALGAVVVLLIGAVVAAPMFMGKKPRPAAQASAAPPSAAPEVKPPVVASGPQTIMPTVSAAPTAMASSGPSESGAPTAEAVASAQPAATPTAPRPHHHATATRTAKPATVKVDVPY